MLLNVGKSPSPKQRWAASVHPVLFLFSDGDPFFFLVCALGQASTTEVGFGDIPTSTESPFQRVLTLHILATIQVEYEELLQMDQVWSLCEIFFVREKHLRKHGGYACARPNLYIYIFCDPCAHALPALARLGGRYVVQSLCTWVKQHFPSAAEEARALLRTGEQLPPPGDATMYASCPSPCPSPCTCTCTTHTRIRPRACHCEARVRCPR